MPAAADYNLRRRHTESLTIKRLRDKQHDNLLPAFSWPGAYPIAYLDKEGNTLCYRCANDNDPELDPALDDYFICEEGTTYCDQCSAVIFEDEDETGE